MASPRADTSSFGRPSWADGEDNLLRGGLRLNHLRMIVALDDLQRVSRAAQVMNMSQPAASRLIAEMETIMGVKLCERLPRGVELTAYGAALARRARTILFEVHDADREIADLKSGKGGTVFLGAVTAPAIDLAVPAVRKMRTTHPNVEISVQVETSTVLARELLASRHDFIIARIPDDLNPRLFRSRVIGVEKACLIVRRGHPLLGEGPIQFDQMVDFDWVMQPSGSLLRRVIENHFLRRNIPPPGRILNTSSLLLTLIMVAGSDSIAPVSMEVAQFIRGERGLAGAVDIVPIDFDLEVQPYSLITLANRALSPAARILHDLVLAEIR